MPPSRKPDKALGSILIAASSSLPVKLFYYTKANSGFVTCALKIALDMGTLHSDNLKAIFMLK